MKMMIFKRNGYTLVELLIVVTIIALITVIAVPSFIKYREDTKLVLCKDRLRLLGHAAEQFFLDNDIDIRTCTEEELAPYIKGSIPTCPKGNKYEFHEGRFHCPRHVITYVVDTGELITGG